MEQRIGPSIQPLQGAAADPAFVPGITGPRPADPKDDKDPVEETSADEGAVSEETAADHADDEADETEDESADKAEDKSADKAGDENPAEESASSEEEADPEGPVFEVSDRRAKITADHSGVRLRLDDQQAEFRWDEIGAVETETSRFGRWFTVTVHTPDRRWYPVEIAIPSRGQVKQWETELDEVLDAYFQE